MKKLGLIGGIGPESTIAYYHGIVYGVQSKLEQPIFPELCIESLSVFEILRYCESGDYEGLTNYVANGIEHLVDAGAEFVAMTGNTPHIVYDQIASKVSVPVISIIEVSCQEAKKKNMKKIGLLGTGVTMTETFFKEPFQKAGINIVTPSNVEIQYISDKIASEIELGIVTEDTQNGMKKIVDRLVKEEQVDAIALGCTELPLVFQNMKLPVEVLDTMRIHIDDLVDRILQ